MYSILADHRWRTKPKATPDGFGNEIIFPENFFAPKNPYIIIPPNYFFINLNNFFCHTSTKTIFSVTLPPKWNSTITSQSGKTECSMNFYLIYTSGLWKSVKCLNQLSAWMRHTKIKQVKWRTVEVNRTNFLNLHERTLGALIIYGG